MKVKENMVKKRVLFLPLILVAGIIPIALASINASRQVESNPTIIVDPKDIVMKDEVLFEGQNTISGNQKYISFVTADDLGMKNTKIWMTNSDGSVPVIVAKAEGAKYVSNPIFSPDSTKLAFMKIYPFQIWVYDIRTGLSKNVESDLKRFEKFFNPALGYGGETYLKWIGNYEIEFENNLTNPAERYSINIESKQIKKSGEAQDAKVATSKYSIQSQRDEKWGDDELGSCETETIHSAGCAVSAVSMLLNGFDYKTPIVPDQITV